MMTRANVYQRDFPAGPSGKYLSVYDIVPPNSRVLELGCSTGYFTDHLIQKCATIIAVDSDPSSIKTCQERGIIAFQIDLSSADIDNLLTDRAPFDIILVMDVLEHLSNPENLLVKLHKYMRPSGRLIVTGPNVAYWHIRWELLRGRWNYTEAGMMDETHLRWFTRATWRKLLEESGFVIIVDKVAESLLPKEYQIRMVPGSGKIIDKIKYFAEWAFPDLVTTIFLFCCRPADGRIF